MLEELQKKYKETFKTKAPESWGEEELNKALGDEPKTPEPKAEPKATENDRIANLERMVEKLSGENSNLRDKTAVMQKGWEEYKAPIAGNKTATVKIYRADADSPAGIITSCRVFKNNAKNEENGKFDKLILSVMLRYDDETTEEIKLDSKELSSLKEVEQIEIVKENSRTLRKVEGYVKSPDTDREGFPKRMLSGGEGFGTSIGSGKVPLEVFMVKSEVTVKRQNGQEFEMDSNYLNL